MRPQRVRDFFQATEAEFDDETLRATVTIIRPGMSGNRKLWAKEALKKASDKGFWNGSRMFLDHSSQSTGLPKKRTRSIKDLVSGIESTEIGEDGRVIASVQFFDDRFYQFAKRARAHMGTSVDLLFAGKEVRESGKPPYYAVEELVTNNSVDWVVFPAAGGQIDEFLSAHEGEDGVEWNELTTDMLRQHRPDLVGALESKGDDNPPTPPVSKDDIAKLVKEAIHEAREEWQTESATRDAIRKQYSTVIQSAKLPTKIANRLTTALENETSFEQAKVDALIKEAKEELEEAGVKPALRGMGRSEGTGDTPVKLSEVAPTHAALESVFTRRASKGQKTTEGGND